MEHQKYGIIYADPPSRYVAWSKRGSGRTAESHYANKFERNMRVAPYKALLHWTARFSYGRHSQTCWRLFKSFRHGDFIKMVAFVWVKRNRKSGSWFWGLGHWTRANAEICLLATRGHPKRQSKRVHQIIDTPIEEHSKKPDITRSRIIELIGDLPRIELFTRQKTSGWDVWGNEVESDIQLL